MSRAAGYKGKAGFKIETGSYGVTATIGAGDQIHFIKETISAGRPAKLKPSRGVADQVAHTGSIGDYKVSGIVTVSAYYRQISMLAAFFGHSPQGASPTGSYEHFFEVSPDMQDREQSIFEKSGTSIANYYRRGTFAVDRGNGDIWQFASMAINSFKLRAAPGGVSFDFGMIGYSAQKNESPNTSSNSWSLPIGNKVLFDHLQVRIRPRFQYTISSANDLLILDFPDVPTDTDVNISLTDGTYTGSELAAMIEKRANNAISGSNVKVAYSPTMRRFSIYSTGNTFRVENSEVLETIGFVASTNSKKFQMGAREAVPDEMGSFSSADQVAVKNLTLNFSNGLNKKSERGNFGYSSPAKMKQARGSLQVELSGYLSTGVDFSQGLTDGEIYTAEIELSSGQTNEEIIFYIPKMKIDSGNFGISGPGLTKPKLGFSIMAPDRFFLDWHYPTDYMVRYFNTALTSISAIGVLDGSLFLLGEKSGDLQLMKVDSPGVLKTVKTESGKTPRAARVVNFKKKLYFALSDDKLYSWDGVNLTAEGSARGDSIADLYVFGNKIHAQLSDGTIDSYDGSAWTVDSGDEGSGWSLYSHNGTLYSGRDTSSSAVHYLDSSWSTERTLGGSASVHMVSHNGILYAVSGSRLDRRNIAPSWETLSLPSGLSAATGMYSFGMNLIITESARIFNYNPRENSLNTLVSGLTYSIVGPGVIYKNRLILPGASGRLIILNNPKSFYCTVKSSISTNPL